MEIEFKERSRLKANIYGKIVELKKPTVGAVEQMQAELAAPGAKSIDVMVKFATELGLSKEIVESMEVDHFTQLMETICGTKKK